MLFNIENIKLEADSKYTPKTFAKAMVKHQGNMRIIGSGYYAGVYAASKKNYVYKICENDSAYTKFIVMLSEQKTQNPYFPIVHGARLITKTGSDKSTALVVCMERLNPIGRQVYPCGVMCDIFQTTPKRLKWLIKTVGIDPVFVDAVDQLYNLVSRNYRTVTFDIGRNNLMLRGNQLVITDPVYPLK